MQTVFVDLGPRSYDIHIGRGTLASLGDICRQVVPSSSACLIVTDETVAGHYLASVRRKLEEAGFRVSEAIVQPGERSKSADSLASMWAACGEAGLDRKSVVVALGGGVVGDLAGFVAASYMRGIEFVQVPTTLLAMVDSSVGGKTGINLPHGKNLAGAFHQPKAVVVDLDVLETLAPREFSAGMAEVIKYGCIWDEEMFEEIEANVEDIRNLDAELLGKLVKRSCEIKAEVVRQDERESGLRSILNYGHTLGHAIENVQGYGKRLHGEAIAIGMVYAARLSERLHALPSANVTRQAALFSAFDLPTSWREYSWERVREVMAVDKKAENAIPKFVLLDKLGHALLPETIKETDLTDVYESEHR